MKVTVRHVVQRGLEFLAFVFASFAALGMISIVGLIFTSVVMRKFANSPLHITEEVVGLLLSVSLFLGLPLVTLRAKHVRVSILVENVSGPVRRALNMIGLALGVFFFAWIVFEAVPWWEFAHRLNLKTETSRILLYPWMAVLPVSLSLTGLILVARFLGVIDNGKRSASRDA